MKFNSSRHLPLLLVTILTLALLLWPLLDTSESGNSPAEDPATAVTVAAVGRGELRDEYPAVGTALARVQVQVVAPLDGQVSSVDAEVGEGVEQGQSLATLDTRLLEAGLVQAKAAALRSEAELGRVRQLAESDIAESRRVEQAVAQAEIDAAEVEKLETSLALSRFPSPLTGIVIDRYVEAGTSVAAGTPLFSVADVSRLRVQLKVPAEIAVSLAVGAEARLLSPGLQEPLPAHVEVVHPAADPLSHQVTVELDAGDVYPRLQPGVIVNALLTLQHKANALLIARSAFPEALAGTVIDVFRVVGSKVERRRVELGAVTDDSVEILSGLDDGDRVVVRGASTLDDGSAVRFTEEPGA